MNNPGTFTAEHRSWEWNLVLQYEDGSLPASAWTPETLGVVASWYARHVTREQARTRYEQYYHRNLRRLSHRLNSAAVPTKAIRTVDAVWESILEDALGAHATE